MSTSIGGGGVSAKSLALTMHGQRILVHTKDLMEEDGQDPYFFDDDYSIAASTGWVVWEGSWAVIELLRDESSWLREMVHHRLLLELGSGTGLLGLCAAAAGAHAILSDVPSVVEGCTLPNVRANTAGGVAGGRGGGGGGEQRWALWVQPKQLKPPQTEAQHRRNRMRSSAHTGWCRSVGGQSAHRRSIGIMDCPSSGSRGV